MSNDVKPVDARRYVRQTRLYEIGPERAARLARGHALIVGVGALGCQLAELLARAGVRKLTLVDPDVVDWSNLQRQTLYVESDAEQRVPKVLAARARLLQINSALEIDIHATEFNQRFLEEVGVPADVDVLLDGLDQFEARLLLNSVAQARGLPYVYGAALGMEGCCLTVLPGSTACLHCLLETPLAHLSQATCATAGVLGSTISHVAALQFTEAVKILVGDLGACRRELLYFNLWENQHLSMPVERLGDCPVCVEGRAFEAAAAAAIRPLCGRKTVQVTVAAAGADFLPRMAARHAGAIERQSPFHLEVAVELGGAPVRLTFFKDGRVFVDGAADADAALALLPEALATAALEHA